MIQYLRHSIDWWLLKRLTIDSRVKDRKFMPNVDQSCPQISCIIPVLGDTRHIGRFIRELHSTLIRLSTNPDIIVVDDGNEGGSRDEILGVGGEISLRYLELSRSFGPAFATQAGLDVARGDCAVVIRQDDEGSIGAIADMVHRWRAGVDLVYAMRGQGRGCTFRHRGGEAFGSLGGRLRHLFSPTPGDLNFCLLDRRLIDALKAMPESDRCLSELCAWAGYGSEAFPVLVDRRTEVGRRLSAMWRGTRGRLEIATYSISLLRLMIGGGMLIAGLALLFAVAMVFEKLIFGQPIPGFTTLASAISFFAGVQLLAIGIVGEYVGRILVEVKRRPTYFISKDVSSNAIEVDMRLRSPKGARDI